MEWDFYAQAESREIAGVFFCCSVSESMMGINQALTFSIFFLSCPPPPITHALSYSRLPSQPFHCQKKNNIKYGGERKAGKHKYGKAHFTHLVVGRALLLLFF